MSNLGNILGIISSVITIALGLGAGVKALRLNWSRLIKPSLAAAQKALPGTLIWSLLQTILRWLLVAIVASGLMNGIALFVSSPAFSAVGHALASVALGVGGFVLGVLGAVLGGLGGMVLYDWWKAQKKRPL